MKRHFVFHCSVLSLVLSTADATAETTRTDVVIYGATPSGITAAISTDRAGTSIVLLAHGRRIGGMMASGRN